MYVIHLASKDTRKCLTQNLSSPVIPVLNGPDSLGCQFPSPVDSPGIKPGHTMCKAYASHKSCQDPVPQQDLNKTPAFSE